MVTCGIDWAQDHHDIAIVNTDGRLVAKRRIPESVAGFAELAAMLADAGDDPEDPIPVAIETPRGLLVAALRATGRPVYPINPMSEARYRERTSMSGKKSDHGDAVTLANSLRTVSTLVQAAAATGDLDRARRLLSQAEDLGRAITSPDEQARAVAALAQAAAATGDLDRAEALASTITKELAQASAVRWLAQTAAATGDLNRARRLLSQAEDLARTMTDPVWQARSLVMLALLLI